MKKDTTLPSYLTTFPYNICYTSHTWAKLLDRPWVPNAILFFQMKPLIDRYLPHFKEDGNNLQTTHAYGDLLVRMAEKCSKKGKLTVNDLNPSQVACMKRKLKDFPEVKILQENAITIGDEIYDTIGSFFLLHEVPYDYIITFVNNILSKVKVGGKVVFVDYHKPTNFLLNLIQGTIIKWLEPSVDTIRKREIKSFAKNPDDFTWEKETVFSGMYQVVVATKIK